MACWVFITLIFIYFKDQLCLGLFCFQFLPSRKILSVSPSFRLAFVFEFLTAVMGSLWYKPPGNACFIDIFNHFI